MNGSDIPANRIPKRSVYNKRNCDKEKCGNEGNYSSKRGYFCLKHILDYDMGCPNKECPRNGIIMDKLVSEIKKDLNGELHQIFLCQSCGFRHDHTVKVNWDRRALVWK